MSIIARIRSGRVSFASWNLIKPLIISSGAISSVTEAEVEVEVEVGGHTAIGRGAILLSDLWSWPDHSLTHEVRDERLRGLCRRLAGDLDSACGGESAHPLELGLRLHHHAVALADAEGIPHLAAAMCASPFDAAVHDGIGQALGRSAFVLASPGHAGPVPSADPLFAEGACAAIHRLLRPAPIARLRAWVLVGKDDDPRRDLAPWVRGRGYRGIKLKLMGRDPEADAERTAEIYRAVREMAGGDPMLSVDTNEGNPDSASVLAYLTALERRDAAAFAALAYLEQPTSRDIVGRPQDWHAVSRRKPVLLDEGLTGLDRLPLAQDQGWSGLALKTCKGHSLALVCAAWAHERDFKLALQDLTNAGHALVHAALFAAHVPTLNGVELNSPQFIPDANRRWLPRHAALVEPSDGFHFVRDPWVIGLGSPLALGSRASGEPARGS